MLVEVCELSMQRPEEEHRAVLKEVRMVVDSFEEVFDNPTRLPPHRGRDDKPSVHYTYARRKRKGLLGERPKGRIESASQQVEGKAKSASQQVVSQQVVKQLVVS